MMLHFSSSSSFIFFFFPLARQKMGKQHPGKYETPHPYQRGKKMRGKLDCIYICIVWIFPNRLDQEYVWQFNRANLSSQLPGRSLINFPESYIQPPERGLSVHDAFKEKKILDLIPFQSSTSPLNKSQILQQVLADQNQIYSVMSDFCSSFSKQLRQLWARGAPGAGFRFQVTHLPGWELKKIEKTETQPCE